VVPTYVLEYLLGQHCATDDPILIGEGLESVRRILAKHYVHRNRAELVKSTIKERGTHKVIDKLTVELNEKGGFYEVEFTNLGLKKVPIDVDLVKRYPKLLVGGIWAITDVEYELPTEPKASPWQISSVQPIQVAGIDHDEFLAARAKFSTDEWMDVLMQSVGFNPAPFSRRGKLLTLIRLIPFCERNYNLLELGPKGTGKSHVYAEFSPHGMLISGIDDTFKANEFTYRPLAGGAPITVLTPEEQQYPAFAGLRPLTSEAAPGAAKAPGTAAEPSVGQTKEAPGKAQAAATAEPGAPAAEEDSAGSMASRPAPATAAQPKEQHLVVPENAKGWSYRRLFADYLQGCSGIIIRDPYIRAFHQIRNLAEFLRMVNEITPVGDEVTVHLITGSDQESMEKQVENLGQVQDSFAGTSTPFTWEIDASPNFHARSITTDHGWKITLDRGLDLFQWFEFSPFNAAAVMQEARMVKGCEVSYIAVQQ
jgi:hypothetical protein